MPSDAERTAARRCGALLVAVYAALALFVLVEQWGRATSDTRFELTEVPGEHIAGTFSLWNPDVSLGELQNQAYGYLFPQGPFFALLDLAGMPGWLTQRLWTVLVLVLACEGVRRLARALGTGPWGAAAAGLAYGLVPRAVTELGTRSAEILPGAMVAWALLPIVLAINGRLRPRNAAVLSAAAFACSGGVNGTATAAPAALLAVVVLWAVMRRQLSWRFGLGWLALVGAVSAWWLVSLLRLGTYSPPFFDYVEDASTTTSTSGFATVLRGASNWVSTVTVGGERWWPAGYDFAYAPWLVLGSGLVAALGVVGLLRMRSPLRTPLLLAAAFGLAAQVIAQTATLDGPVSQAIQDLLDGPLAPLRNVPKVDPVLRVPLALGVGVLVDDLVRQLHVAARRRGWRGRARRAAAGGLLVALTGGLLALAQPIATADTRTPGWEQVPDYWTDATDFVADRARRTEGGGGVTWVVPGSGFGIQQWGWTMEEPMEAVARTPWVTRSQVPLTPPETIRLLSTLESYLETGAGSPYLRHMLNRIGIDTVLVRHDLEPDVARATPASLVGVAIARSPGLERVKTFGRLQFGPAIEVFEVEPAAGALTHAGGYDVRDLDDAVTVGGSVEDAVSAVGSGIVAPEQAVVLAGTPGWEAEATVVGDGYRRRERAFGQLHDAESNVMTRDDPYRGDRVVPNYPGAAGARPVVAEYDGIAGVDASSSNAWADALGELHPEDAPWSALDQDASTYWRPAPYLPVRDQWLEVDLGRSRTVGTVTLQEASAYGLDPVLEWRVSAGGEHRTVAPNPFTGRAEVDLDVRADKVRVQVADAPDRLSAVGLADLSIEGVEPSRTLVMPEVETDGPPDLIFSARPEVRACVTTLLGPDCDRFRRRAAEEATGIDRTFRLEQAGEWRVRGLVVARSRTGTFDLLDPLSGVRIRGSSWLADDPTISPRMAYDADPSSSWVADPRDPEPTLTVDLGRVRTVRRLAVLAPAGIAVRPDRAVIRAVTADGEEQVREVSLTGVGAFAPIRARRLTITFSRQVATSGSLPIGVGEVRLGGAEIAVPLEGGGPTGATCGLGPELLVDGRLVRTRVEGLVGDVVAAGQLAVLPCGDDDRPLRLGAGEHRVRLRSTEQFQPVGLTLNAVDSRRPVGPFERSRSIRLVSSTDTRVVLDVGRGEGAVVSAPHNVNAGWVATVDGKRLEPTVVDGWAQGWLLPAGTAGEVELVFEPQRGYLVGLVGGLVLLGLVLLWAAAILVVGGVRRSSTAGTARSAPAPGSPTILAGRRGSPRRTRLAAAVVLAGLVGWLVGGPVVGAACAAGVALARWPRVVQALVGVVLLGALVWFVVLLADDARNVPRAVDLVTGAGLGVALAAGLTRRPDRHAG